MDSFRYLRLYGDESGETHFEDVELPLEATEFAPPPGVSLGSLGEVQTLLVAGIDSRWPGNEPHSEPAAQFVVHLAGTAEITASDGETRSIRPGDVVLVDDTGTKGHSTRVVDEVVSLVIRTSAAPNQP